MEISVLGDILVGHVASPEAIVFPIPPGPLRVFLRNSHIICCPYTGQRSS